MTAIPSAAPICWKPAGALHWHGDTWEVTFDGRTVSVRDCKGLHDIAALMQRPGTDVHVLDLVASPIASGATGPVLGRTAAAQYRRRLTQLSEEREAVTQLGDTAGLELLGTPRAQRQVVPLSQPAVAPSRPPARCSHR